MPKHTYSAGGVVINPRGEVLVVNQNGNSWSLPKGQLNPGETARAAAMREIAEESGVNELQFVRELGSYDRYHIGLDGSDDISELKTITMFLYRSPQLALQPHDPHNPTAQWVAAGEVPQLLTHQKDKLFFESILPQLADTAQ